MRLVFSCLVGLVLGLTPLVSHSRADVTEKEPAFQENFYGVQILGNRAWIVGYYGTILHSNDRGATWELQQIPTRSALFRVRMLSEKKGWISGSYGALLHTADGGKNWSAQPTGTTEHLFGLTSVDEQLGWAVGSRGTILRTRDGGGSWTDSSLREDLILSSVSFVSPKRGWIVGEFGVIYQTRDGGKSWVKQTSPVEVSIASGESRNLFALLFADSKTGWAFGLDGVVLRTRGGSRWEIARKKGDHHLFAAAVFNARLWAVGERGALLQSEADSNDWRRAKAAIPPLSLNNIAFGKDGFGLVVGNRGLILRTNDGGRNWERLKIRPQGPGKGLSLAP